MSNDDYERGRTDERLDTHEQWHNENKQRFDAIEAKLNELVQTMAVAKGGVRILLAVGTLSATIGAFAHSFFGWIGNHWK